MMKLIKYFLCELLAIGLVKAADTEDPKSRVDITLPGDIILGGLFPMHESGPPERPCGNIKKEKGIQRLEAMLFARDQINADLNLLPNITLGTLIMDTCSSATYALEQSIEFFRTSMSHVSIAFFEILRQIYLQHYGLNLWFG